MAIFREGSSYSYLSCQAGSSSFGLTSEASSLPPQNTLSSTESGPIPAFSAIPPRKEGVVLRIISFVKDLWESSWHFIHTYFFHRNLLNQMDPKDREWLETWLNEVSKNVAKDPLIDLESMMKALYEEKEVKIAGLDQKMQLLQEKISSLQKEISQLHRRFFDVQNEIIGLQQALRFSADPFLTLSKVTPLLKESKETSALLDDLDRRLAEAQQKKLFLIEARLIEEDRKTDFSEGLKKVDGLPRISRLKEKGPLSLILSQVKNSIHRFKQNNCLANRQKIINDFFGLMKEIRNFRYATFQ